MALGLDRGKNEFVEMTFVESQTVDGVAFDGPSRKDEQRETSFAS